MRVVIAEDQVLLREGIARLFADAGHEVVGSLGDTAGLLELIEQTDPDLVVLDVRMPPTFFDEGIQAALEVKRHRPHTGVLMLSQHIEASKVTELVGEEGFGYLLKDRVLDVEQFLDAATRVADRGSALDPKVVAGLVAPTAGAGHLDALSAREREVLQLMAEGLTNAGIATRLFVSERTVEAHVRHLLLKLDIAEDAGSHRRVLAVLAHLRASATG